LIAYVWTFIVISVLWFQHQRLFSNFFVPNPATVVVNFTALGLIGLIVYFVQLFGRFHGEAEKIYAALAYFFVLGLTLLSFGILYAHGVNAKWDHLDREMRYIGVRYALRGAVTGACMLIGVLICVARGAQSFSDIYPLFGLAFLGVIAARFIALAVKPRIVDAAHG
jgi:uncharacterized membrane protein